MTPWTAARQDSLSFTISQSLLKLMFIESVMPSNHLILCHPLLLLHAVFPSIRVFSNESVLCIMWPKYWSYSFGISPSNEEAGYRLLLKHLKKTSLCTLKLDKYILLIMRNITLKIKTFFLVCPYGFICTTEDGKCLLILISHLEF